MQPPRPSIADVKLLLRAVDDSVPDGLGRVAARPRAGILVAERRPQRGVCSPWTVRRWRLALERLRLKDPAPLQPLAPPDTSVQHNSKNW